MAVVVLSKTRQALSRGLLGSSLAGDGMLVRLRSTTIGLLGLVTFVGLALIAFVSQIGWPGVLSGPLPAAPAPGVVQNDTIALVQAETHPLLATRGGAGGRPQTTANRHGETASSVESDVADADQLTEAPAEPPVLPDPGPSGPPAQTAPGPVSQPTGQEPPTSAPASGEDEDGVGKPTPVAAGAEGKSRGREKEKKGRERDDLPGNSGDRHDDRRGAPDDHEDEGSSSEDRWDGDDEDSDKDWDDDEDWDDDHDEGHRGKSDDRRH
jgi:hypothetical protein